MDYVKCIILYLFILLLCIIFCMFKTIYEYIFNGFTGLFMNFYSKEVPLKSLGNIYHEEKYILCNDESNNIKNKILSLRDNWKKRNIVLYTLGKSSYLLDEIKLDIINKSNQFMKQHFNSLYILLLKELKNILNTENVEYKKNSFLPGFHIFVPNYLFQYPLASFHMDKQYAKNNWESNCNFNDR